MPRIDRKPWIRNIDQGVILELNRSASTGAKIGRHTLHVEPEPDSRAYIGSADKSLNNTLTPCFAGMAAAAGLRALSLRRLGV